MNFIRKKSFNKGKSYVKPYLFEKNEMYPFEMP